MAISTRLLLNLLFAVLCFCLPIKAVDALSPLQTLHQSVDVSAFSDRLSDHERAWLADNPKIHIGIMNAWPPMDYVDNQGQPQGIGTELIHALNKRLDNRLVIVPGPWKQNYQAVVDKRLNALMDITPRPDREPLFHFTRPYIHIPHNIFTHKDEPYKATLADLTGKKVGVEQGFFIVQLLKTKYPQINVREYATTSDALDALSKREIDAYVGNRAVAMYIIENELITNLKAHGKISATSSVNAIGVRKDQLILRNILQKALNSISSEERRRMNKKWLNLSVVETNEFQKLELSTTEQAWLQNPPVVRIAFDENYPPYSFRSAKGEFIGIAVDFAKELARRSGITLEIYPEGQWKRLYKAARDREVDVIATLVKREERGQWFDFTRPYLSLAQYVITRKEDADRVTDPGKLAGMKMALVEGYSMTKVILEEIKDIQPYYVANLSEALAAVSVGKADAAIGAIGMANHLITKAGLINLGFATLYSQGQSEQRFGIRKDWPELASILDKTIATLSDEEILSIFSKWTRPEIARVEAELSKKEVELSDNERVWLKSHPIIRVHNEQNWAPFNYFKKGEPKGYSIDYMNLLAKKLGLKVDYVSGPTWHEFLNMLKNKQLDVMLNMVKSVERQEFANFTDDYLRSLTGIYVSKSAPHYSSLRELEGKTLALPKGFFEQQLIERHYPRIRMHLVKDNLEALEAVLLGKADAAIGELAVMSHLMLEHSILDLRLTGKISDKRFDNVLSIGVRKDWPILHGLLQKAMDTVSYDEEQRLKEKWLARALYDPSPPVELTAEEKIWLKAHREIEILVPTNLEPYSFFDDRGKAKGITIDFARIIGDKLGVGIELKPVHDSVLTAKIKDRSTVAASYFLEPEQGYGFSSTSVYSPIDLALIARKGSVAKPFSIEKFTNKKIAMYKGVDPAWTKIEAVRNNEIIFYETVREGLNAVLTGKADAWLDAYQTAMYFIKRDLLTELEPVYIENNVAGMQFHVRDDHPELLSILNKTIENTKEKELLAIRVNWGAFIKSEFIALSPKERAWLDENPVLSLGYDIDWPPVEYVDKGEQYKGISADYFALIEKMLGVTIKPVKPQSWQSTINAARKGELDLLSAVAPTPQRNEYLRFTKPYLSFPMVIVTDESVSYINDMKELEGRVVTVVSGYASHDMLVNSQLKIELRPVKDIIEGLKAVQQGEAFAFIGNLASISHVMGREGITGLKVTGETPYSYDLAIGVSKDQPVLAGLMQKALDAIPEGKRIEIYNRWVAVTYERGFDYSLLWKLMLPIIAVILLLALWNRQLNRAVNRKTRQLMVNEERYHDLIENAPVGIGLSIPGGRLLEANALAINMFGYNNREEFLSVPPTAHYYDPDDRDRFIESIREGVTKGFEVRFKHKDGTPFWALMTAIRQVNESGEPRLLIVVEDITERKENEIELENHRKHLEKLVDKRTVELRQAMADVEKANQRLAFTQTAVDSARDAYMFVRVADATFAYVSNSTCEALGYTKEELMGLRVFDIDPDYPESEWDNLMHYVKGEKYATLESHHKKKNGDIFPVEISLTPFEYEGEEYIIANIRDITDRKLAERAVRESEERYRTLVSNSPGTVYRCRNDADWSMEFISDGVKTLSGYPPGDFINNQVRSFASIIHPDDVQLVDDKVQEGVRERRPYEMTYRIIRDDGTTRWVDERGLALLSDEGEVEWLEGILVDVTERKAAEDKLKHSMDDLERFNRLAVGREKQIITLKKEINVLLKQLGQESKFKSVDQM